MGALLKAISPTTWLVILIAVLVVGVGWKLKSDKKEIKTLEKTTVTQGVQIQSQATTIKTDQKVEQVKEEVHADVREGEKRVESTFNKAALKQDRAEREITQHFDTLPKTVENIVAEQTSLAAVRIDGAWDAYCAAVPDAKECQPPPQGVPHV